MTPKQSSFWWIRNLNSTIYFLRELTGPVIAAYFVFLLTTFYPARDFFYYIAFSAAIFHTITWLWITAKLTPFPLKKWAQILLFLVAIIGWLAASYLILQFFYVQR